MGPVSESIRAGTQRWEEEAGIIVFSLEEEIATTRHMLRNVLATALECEDVEEFTRLVEIYGSGCLRLVRMLKRERGNHDHLERYLVKGIERAIDEIRREWGRSGTPSRHSP
jgi:hypothetical protein